MYPSLLFAEINSGKNWAIEKLFTNQGLSFLVFTIDN